MGRTRTLWITALALAAVMLPGEPVAAAPAAHCLTPVALDGHEPPCNPSQADPVWATNHRSPYAQASSPYPAPRPGDPVTWQRVPLGTETPVILQFSAPYPDGQRTAWFSTVGMPETRAVYKLDTATGEVLGRETILSEAGGRPQAVASTSGVYNLLDRDNHLITVRESGFAIYGDVRPGERTSPIRLLHRFDLPARAKCRPDDRVIGITLTYDGHLAFATVQGMVGVVPREPARMAEEHLSVASINGAACADPDAALEEVANSIAADEDGGIYPVSTLAQYRFDVRDGRIRRTWRAPYASGGGAAGATLSTGSGSTPTLMGTGSGDRFVAITDGRRLMHLTLFWRDEIPPGWTPIAPGKDRRIACEVPVRFGDPDADESISEQSVLVRGYGAVVVNNALALDRAFGLLPPNVRPLSALSGNVPSNGPRGMERIDWDPHTRTCRSTWANPDVSIPNAVPTMSVESGLIYGTGVRNGTWGLEGIDWRTGERRLWVPTTPLPTENSFFSATTVGPGGDIWQGGVGGLQVFRGPARPEPALACRDLDPPITRLAALRISRRGLRIAGTGRDAACGRPAGIARVEVAVARVDHSGRCRHVGRRGTLGRARRPCGNRRWHVAARSARFAWHRGRALPRGRYRVWARATDLAGLVESPGRTGTRSRRVR